jgi:antitoxin MazE
MKVTLVSVGNSRGIRLPKAVLDQCQFTDTAELKVEDGRLVLTPISAPRAKWAEAFAAAEPKALTAEDHDWLDATLDAEDA